MSVGTKIAALVEALRGESFEGMRPADRRHLRDLCRFIAAKADPDIPKEASGGVLHELKNGAPRHE